MARRKIGPESFGSFLLGGIGVVFWACVGVFASAVFLLLTPVNEVRRMPTEEDREEGIYYVEGQRSGIDGAGWVAKRNEFISETMCELALNEQELNQWSSAAFSDRRKDFMVELGSAKIEPGIPNFRIADDVLQIGIPIEITGIGERRRIVLQTSGTIASDSDAPFRLIPDAVFVGSCRIPSILGISSSLLQSIGKVVGAPEEIANSWPTLSEVSVAGNSLKLSRL